MTDIPNGFDAVVRPAYLQRLRDDAFELCKEHLRDAAESTQNSETIQRAFVLSLFGIFMSKAAETPGLQHLQDVHPIAKLPFRDLQDKVDEEQAYRKYGIKSRLFF